jgi:hypothetical protein
MYAGLYDLMVGHYEFGVSFFINRGTASQPSFEYQQGNEDPFSPFCDFNEHLAYVPDCSLDLNADGRLDCIMGTMFDGILTYMNIGSKSVPRFRELKSVENPFYNVDVGAYVCPAVVINLFGNGATTITAGSFNGRLTVFDRVHDVNVILLLNGTETDHINTIVNGAYSFYPVNPALGPYSVHVLPSESDSPSYTDVGSDNPVDLGFLTGDGENIDFCVYTPFTPFEVYGVIGFAVDDDCVPVQDTGVGGIEVVLYLNDGSDPYRTTATNEYVVGVGTILCVCVVVSNTPCTGPVYTLSPAFSTTMITFTVSSCPIHRMVLSSAMPTPTRPRLRAPVLTRRRRCSTWV